MPQAIVPDAPRFRLRWLAGLRPRWPDWLEDPAGGWTPAGERAVYTRVKGCLREVLADLEREGPVLLPSYAPGGVTWAALDAGRDVNYYPVCEDLSLSVDDVLDRIREVEPAVVLFIHYFGFVDDHYAALREAAREAGAFIVEDCARGLFSRDADGALLGSTGDLSLFCLYKTLPVPNGGLVVSRDRPLPEAVGVRAEHREAVMTAGATLLARIGVRARRSVPDVNREHRLGPTSVADSTELLEPGGISRRGLRRCNPPGVQEARLERYAELRERLEGTTAHVVTPRAPARAAPYGVAVLTANVDERARLYDALHRRRLPGEVLTWPPIYRHQAVDAFDGASALRRRLVVLPTHQQVPEETIPKLADCVRENVE